MEDGAQLTRWEVLRNVVLSKWRRIILGLWTLVGVYDLLVGQLLPIQWAASMPRVFDLLHVVRLTWHLWVIGFLFLLTVVVFESLYGEISRLSHLVRLQRSEPAELAELGQLRTEGVKIRNSWASITRKDELPDLQSIYEDWNDRVLSTFARLSPGQATWLKTLDRWRWRYQGLTRDHTRYLNIIDEKLRRLDLVLQKYLGLS